MATFVDAATKVFNTTTQAGKTSPGRASFWQEGVLLDLSCHKYGKEIGGTVSQKQALARIKQLRCLGLDSQAIMPALLN